MHKDSESSRRIDQTAIVTSQDNRKVIAKKYIPFGCDIVLTIAPRKDAHDDDDQDETAESLIQCTVQVYRN